MEYKAWKGFCLCSLGGCFPENAVSVTEPFAPLVFLVDRDPTRSRGWFSVSSMAEATEAETMDLLLPAKGEAQPLDEFLSRHGATVLNTAFAHAFDFLTSIHPKSRYKLTLVGLGDVGGTLLTALKLLGKEISEIQIFDPNAALCSRYEMELNQVLSVDGATLPKVTVCAEDQLFDCDLFLFTASRGVPPVGSQVGDVRMMQFDLNRKMLTSYAKQARAVGYLGLFCQISDPVDQLSRAVFLDSNRTEAGVFDGKGLLPEQVQGFGLGVMAARAAYFAEKLGIDFSQGLAFGPHGNDLIIANSGEHYDARRSKILTEATVTANLKVRDLGFKPYIAPALSSAAASILRLLRGQLHYGAVPLGKAYFGCQSKLTLQGLKIHRSALHPELTDRLRQVHRRLEDFSYD